MTACESLSLGQTKWIHWCPASTDVPTGVAAGILLRALILRSLSARISTWHVLTFCVTGWRAARSLAVVEWPCEHFGITGTDLPTHCTSRIGLRGTRLNSAFDEEPELGRQRWWPGKAGMRRLTYDGLRLRRGARCPHRDLGYRDRLCCKNTRRAFAAAAVTMIGLWTFIMTRLLSRYQRAPRDFRR